MNEPTYEYVISGCNFMDLPSKHICIDSNIKFYEETLKSVQGKNNHNISALYNAFQEKKIGEAINTHWHGNHNVYADSGGLQMITQGIQFTPQIKDEIYRHQARYSDFGLCFDEIPVVLTGKSLRGDTTNRHFSIDLHEECGRLTGQNIKRQLDIFEEENSTCRPLIITQGNCYETYMSWTEYIMDELPPEYYSRIGGVAMASAALGNGLLEDIKKAFYFSQIPKELTHNHIHLLGVGTLTRMVPAMVFEMNGVYKDTVVSYDSTTHTMGISFGNATLMVDGELKNISLGRELNQMYVDMLANIKTEFPSYTYSVEEYHHYMNQTISQGLAEDSMHDRFKTHLLFVLTQIMNMSERNQTMSKDIDLVARLFPKGVEQIAIKMLYDVKTIDDFKAWEDDIGFYISSTPIKQHQSTDITALFD